MWYLDGIECSSGSRCSTRVRSQIKYDKSTNDPFQIIEITRGCSKDNTIQHNGTVTKKYNKQVSRCDLTNSEGCEGYKNILSCYLKVYTPFERGPFSY